MKILSIVSGTSTDGLSMAIFDLFGIGINTDFSTITSRNFEYSQEMRENLLKIASGKLIDMAFISEVHWQLGRFIDQCALELGDDFDLISYSGHTVFHGPSTGNIQGGTFQIGEISLLCARTGATAIYDYRATDMAFGGLGAPLTAASDYLILHDPGTLCINIGGIGNVTYINRNGFLAFDTGPGNMLIDLAAMKFWGENYDRNGNHAAKGTVNQGLLNHLLKDEYLQIPPPKNSGREYYNENYLNGLLERFRGIAQDDFLRTITRFTSSSIYDQVNRFATGPVNRIIVGGGGSLNPVIMEDLEEVFGKPIMRFSEIGIDDMVRECLGFAVLANQTIHLAPGRITDFANLTGNVLGKIMPGKNFRQLMEAKAD